LDIEAKSERNTVRGGKKRRFKKQMRFS